ncbi:MAG: gamma-glutamyl-gamma-aminobutyrate hydrolase family protein [Nitrososphaera sp.]|jgi:GMP synthase (glutamine-hydrolysing)
MLLLVDNGSVFTKNITDFLTHKTEFVVEPFDKIRPTEIVRFDSFILSGRRQNNQQMNAINSKIIKHAISEEKPLLGICYGAEILALATGGTIRKMNSAQKGESTVTVTEKNPLCSGVINVYQSHSFEISQLGLLVPLAYSVSCKYEMVRYKDTMIFGTQFHPEMTQDGLALIERFISLDFNTKPKNVKT